VCCIIGPDRGIRLGADNHPSHRHVGTGLECAAPGAQQCHHRAIAREHLGHEVDDPGGAGMLDHHVEQVRPEPSSSSRVDGHRQLGGASICGNITGIGDHRPVDWITLYHDQYRTTALGTIQPVLHEGEVGSEATEEPEVIVLGGETLIEVQNARSIISERFADHQVPSGNLELVQNDAISAAIGLLVGHPFSVAAVGSAAKGTLDSVVGCGIWQATRVGSPLLVVASPEMDFHATPDWHPENRARLDAALAGIDEADLGDAVEWREPRLATLAELSMAHDPLYVDAIRRFCEAGGGELDPDTIATAGSWDTARRSAGAVLDAVDALRAGEHRFAFAAGRPPGHHAVRDQAMGFCLFNNAAIGAASIAAAGERVVIFDWDVHHGNGTQDIFYDNPNVFYISTHESPLYPGTGKLRETGGAHAERTTLNLPFPAGTSGDVYRAAFDQVIAPAIAEFNPDWLIISAGYDGHRDDPLAGLQLTAADYADLAVRAAELVPDQRLLAVLEGGYSPRALTRSVGATLAGLLGEPYRPEAPSTGDIGLPTITAARQLWEIA